MLKPGRTASADQVLTYAGKGLLWAVRLLALLWIGLSLLMAIPRLIGAGEFLVYLATRGTYFDIWGLLSFLEVLFVAIAVVGGGLALRRRKILLGALVAILAWPIGLVVEATRCDYPACRAMAWAALPRQAGEWGVRMRPVTDANEARAIASGALFEAGSSDDAYDPKQFDGYWIVPTTNAHGWPGARAVKVDMRTGATRFVQCPADRMLCGMERPVVLQAGQVFGNAEWGLAATFRAGRAVCMERSEDETRQVEPRGFYAMVRDAEIPCDIVDPSRALGLAALKARTVTEARSEPCKPLSPERLEIFGGRPPTLAGYRSIACEEVVGDAIAVSVFTFASPHTKPAAPSTLYEAWMLTDADHLAEDARLFATFLGEARLPASSR